MDQQGASECAVVDSIAPVGDSNLRGPIRMPVYRRGRSFDPIDGVWVAENRQALRTRGFAGVVDLVSIEIFLSNAMKEAVVCDSIAVLPVSLASDEQLTQTKGRGDWRQDSSVKLGYLVSTR